MPTRRCGCHVSVRSLTLTWTLCVSAEHARKMDAVANIWHTVFVAITIMRNGSAVVATNGISEQGGNAAINIRSRFVQSRLDGESSTSPEALSPVGDEGKPPAVAVG